MSPILISCKPSWALAAALTLLVVGFRSACLAQQTPAASKEEEETLFERENDPTATLTQIQIKDIYTPAEYGTNAQPNTVQIRSVLAISPLALIRSSNYCVQRSKS